MAMRRQPPTDPSGRLAVRRACAVCEWTADLLEEPDADPDCPWCHGPTIRVEVLANTDASGGARLAAAALGRIGGSKGGYARAASLSAQRRREIARDAAHARWHKKPGESKPPKR
jgi:hypothetical protein